MVASDPLQTPVSDPVFAVSCADRLRAAPIVPDHNWRKELHRTGGSGRIALAGDRSGDRAAGGAAVLSRGKLSLPTGLGKWAHRRLRGVHGDGVDGDLEAAPSTHRTTGRGNRVS